MTGSGAGGAGVESEPEGGGAAAALSRSWSVNGNLEGKSVRGSVLEKTELLPGALCGWDSARRGGRGRASQAESRL